MELTQRVEALLNEIHKTHKYSMSRIYGLYNEVFGLAETPQSCASCLIRKTNRLKDWLNEQTKQNSSRNLIKEPSKSEKKKRGRKPKDA